jgi:hypothetical protein
LRIIAFRPLHDSSSIEKTHDAVGRLRALGHPGFGLFQIEFQPLGFVLWQQRIEIAQPLDETAVARCAAVGDDDVIKRPFFGAGARHANNKHYAVSFRC